MEYDPPAYEIAQYFPIMTCSQWSGFLALFVTSQVLPQQSIEPWKTCLFNGQGTEINAIISSKSGLISLDLPLLAAIALGRDGILHPAPLVAHVEILVVVAREISSALHRHLAAWHHRSTEIMVISSRRLLRAQAHPLSMSLAGMLRPLLARVLRPLLTRVLRPMEPRADSG